MNWPGTSGWYDALYGDDPSADNIFGREDLAARATPLLHVFLAHGGRLGDFSLTESTAPRDPARTIAAMDQAMSRLDHTQ